jgi:hypothetical protein
MKLKILDKDSNELDIEEYKYYNIGGSKRDTKINLSDRYNQIGSTDLSSIFFGAKKIDIDLKIPSKTDIEFRSKLNKIASFFQERRKPFYLVDYENPSSLRQTEIIVGGNSDGSESGLKARLTSYKLELYLKDGLWEEPEITYTENALVSGGTFEIVMPDFCFDTYFILSVEATSATPNNDFYFLNTTINKSFRIKENTFTTGKIFLIDSTGSGSITLASVERSRALTSGTFFPLISGSNIIEYGGINDVNIIVKYKPRFEF